MTASRAYIEMQTVALIGFGAIARSIRDAVPDSAPDIAIAVILVRADKVEAVRREVGGDVLVTDSIDALLASDATLVVEAAGHGAVIAYGEQVLLAGRDLYVLSTGALAIAEHARRLCAAASAGSAQILVPAGAMAGFDGLRSLREAGLQSVTYTSTKPPKAWRGTPAEAVVNAASHDSPFEVASGSAQEIAVAFPQNANLAAAVAFAGLGLDATRIRLVADPRATVNTGRIEAVSEHGRLDVTLEGGGFLENPKTSVITGYSVVAALRNRVNAISFV